MVPVPNSTGLMKNMDNNGFMGCFVGLAVGDSLGAPIEFIQRGRVNPYFSQTFCYNLAYIHGYCVALEQSPQHID